MGKKRYYKKRQIIDVTDFGSIDFGEEILICVPRFAWSVARSYLSIQAQWESSYATEYFENGYTGPSVAQLDIIKANIADFLEAIDMSCDLEAVLQTIADILQDISEQEGDTTVLSCARGSNGAGGSEATATYYQDTGTDPPAGFPSYGEYETFKCAAATLIVEEIEKDLEWVKGQALTSITAVLFAGALLSPIPGDEVALFVGLVVSYFLEGLLDSIIDEIRDELAINFDDLVCNLYLAIDALGAQQVMSVFGDSFLGSSAQYLLRFFINNDSFNRLFQTGNFLLPVGTDCSLCAPPATAIEDSFTDTDGVLLPAHTPEQGGPWVTGVGTFEIDDNEAKTTGTDWSRIMIGSTLIDARVSMTLNPTSGGQRSAKQGVIFRVQDVDNFLTAGWTGGSNARYWIAEVVGGVRNTLTFVSVSPTYASRVLLAKAEGDDIDLYVDGVPTLSWTTTRFNSEAGFGFQLGRAQGSRVDNFLVNPLS